MKPIYYRIDEAAAQRAKEMYSFAEYNRGSKTAEYESAVDEAYKLADWAAELSPDSAEKVYGLADSFSRRLAEWCNQMSAIEGRCPSVMVCGPANFPIKKKERQNAAMVKHWEKRNKINHLLEIIRSIGNSAEIIRSDDDRAIEKLRAKIGKMEESQALMKEVNAYYRKHETLEGCDLINDKQREEIEQNMRLCTQSKVPFAPYSLSNNRQNIIACTKRLACLEATKELGSSRRAIIIDGEKVDVVENTELMRIQFVFPGKPSDEIREVLKKHAFRWSNKNKAWQRQLTHNGRLAARKAIEELAS